MGDKQQWTNDQLKCLLETCIEEINTVGRKGLSLHKDSWTKLGIVLKEKFGLELGQKQMKNAYDNLKAKYTGWVYLKNKTGNIYNAQTNTFTLTNEEWEEFRKGHPKAASLNTVPLPFPELCAQLFDGNAATGNGKWTSTQRSGVGSSSCHRVQQLLIYNDTEEDDTGTYHHTSETNPDHIHDSTFEPTPERTPEPSPEPNPEPNPKKRAKTSKSSSINADDLALDIRQALQYLVKRKETPPTPTITIAECSEKLKLVGLDPVNPLFLAAYNIFGGTSNMREAWMSLPDIPEVLRGWLVMTTTTLGQIK
ncbi:hypothetical protein SSX86_032678 [Deinandra increscens subsp. villosa]|uniref:Myb/SANT-like domain-containing protein n=1 Tax=Deinandra increscens subsp. villosa TaxID=3103831 RepID=A0AAP0GHI1_9ASTR